MKSKKIIIEITLIAIMLLLGVTDSKAVVQSSGGTVATYNINTWIQNVRDMEKLGGGFGLNETLNGNLTSSSGSNNIDIHMEKNTEYGAMAILSASSYGNPNKIASGETTTGNVTGIVININKEWVAAGTITYATTYYNAASKYKNVQTGTYVEQKGDAISKTAGWHGSTSSQWLLSTNSNTHTYNSTATLNNPGLLRAYGGSIFSYYGYAMNDYGASQYYDAYYTKAWASRSVVIVGEGI